MEQKVDISIKESEMFYNSLTEQEKVAMDKLNKKLMKPYLENQAKIQNGLQNAFTKFIQTNKRV